MLAILPFNGNRSLSVKPSKVISAVTAEKNYLTVDQVARFIVSGDSTVRLIDVRSPEEYKSFTLSGAINLPYTDLLRKDPSAYLGKNDIKNILFSNGDFYSGYALALATGMNYRNVYVMKGGINEWFNTVMNSRFTGERITPAENALFETRTKAKRLFTEMNSLPDSIKAKLLASRKLEAKKLDGGCE
jgi:rhodanese-related sulfurtransferase